MSKQAWIGSLALTLLVIPAGCGFQYNGAIGFEDEPAGRPEAAARSADVTPAAEPAAAPMIHDLAAFDGRGDERVAPIAFTELNTSGPPANPAMRPETNNVHVGSASALTVFGQLPEHTGVNASPLDSPGNVRRITEAPEGADFDPAVDPTGTWIAYASTRHRETSDIYRKRVGGTALTQLTNDPGNESMPAFSPDGRQIAFASDRTGNWDIYITDTDNGAQAIQLTNDPTHDIHPSFSPDGSQLVYCSYGAQSGQWEIVLMDIDTPGTRRIIGHGLFPEWSPNGDKIVFQRARQRGTRWFSVWTIDIVDGEAVRPTEIASARNAAAITPSWSPDGKFIVFSTVVDPQRQPARPKQADVWIIAADGTGRANLTHSTFANLQPVWGRDGMIYFISNRAKGGQENVWAIRPDQATTLVQQHQAKPTATAEVPTD